VAISRGVHKGGDVIGSLANVVRWDGRTLTGWEREVDGALAVVNLAGENIGSGHWSRAKKEKILQSRLDATRAVVAAIRQASRRPKVVIQGSATGYYGSRGDDILDENSSGGGGFLAEVCRQWEQTIKPARSSGIKVATVRLGVVLGRDGGLMAHILPVFRLFLGGRPGDGKQWFSWVHIADVVAAFRFLIENDLKGTFNLTAPNPVLSGDFYKLLADVMHRSSFFPMPAAGLKLLMGEKAAELLLSSQRVIPGQLMQAGYEFKYADAGSAIEDVVKKTR
jgi:uncharacterized protein (TIGR01777 family)